jgi:hypothetical protein
MPKASGREKINTNGRGRARHRGMITSLEIQNVSRTASITLDNGEGSTWKYNLTKDNDSSFNAMVSLCVAARFSTPPAYVRITSTLDTRHIPKIEKIES